MKTLRISKDIDFPADTVTQKLAWIGTTGSGKTYGASKLAEQFWHIGAQFVAIDPVGVWYGLRLAKDGKKPSDITVPIFGGLHGDVPLEPTAGALLANLVVDKDLSCIIDVSQFESDAEKARFTADFGARLFFRKKAAPSAMHLFLEECQEFVPQNPQRGEERMLHEFIRMQKLGRNFGIGSSYITQRPQEVNKKALNMAQTLFVFRTTGTHERTAIEKWVEDKSLDQSIAQDLPKLATGTCHVWSPEFLKVSETTRILEKETFNASATPEVGVAAKKRELAPIDLEKVRTDMAATIEKAKQEDPKALRKRISELETQAKQPQRMATSDPLTIKQAVDKAVAATEREVNARINQELFKWQSEVLKTMETWFDTLKMLGDTMQEWKKTHRIEPQKYMATEKIQYVNSENVRDRGHIGIDLAAPGTESKTVISSNGSITGPEQRILNAVAWMENVGIANPVFEMVAFLSGYGHALSKGFTVPRGALKTRELITYPTPGRIGLTDAGRAFAEFPDRAGNSEELQRTVLDRLDGPKQRLLRPLLAAYPNDMSFEDLSQAAGYAHPLSKGFTVPRGKLKTFGLIDYPTPGRARATDILFI